MLNYLRFDCSNLDVVVPLVEWHRHVSMYVDEKFDVSSVADGNDDDVYDFLEFQHKFQVMLIFFSLQAMGIFHIKTNLR